MSSARFITAIAGASAFTLAAGLVVSTGAAWADNPLAPRTSFTMVVNPGTAPWPRRRTGRRSPTSTR